MPEPNGCPLNKLVDIELPAFGGWSTVMKPQVPGNPEFDYLRRAPTGFCWWCGSLADSREHKYKRTDLVRLQGEGSPLIWGGDPEKTHQIRSVKKSEAVRFGTNMCRACNGTRSQPFDRAYDEYVAFLWKHKDHMWYWDGISMPKVFGDRWVSKQLDLARYFAKHFGSRIVEEGIEVPAGLIDFMNGATKAANISMCFAKREDLWEMHKGLRGVTDSPPGLWLGGMNAWLSSDRSEVVGLQTNCLFGYVGVEFMWDENSRDMDSFFPHEVPALNEFLADPKLVESIRSRSLESSDPRQG
jgi:hypothetical protein